MREVVFGDNQQARRVFIQPMNNAGPDWAANGGKMLGSAVCQQCVDQRAGLCTGRGMHDEIFLLVDNKNVIILIDDVQRDGLGLNVFEGTRCRDCHGDFIAESGAVTGLAGLAVDQHGHCRDQALNMGTREMRQALRRMIESNLPQVGVLAFNEIVPEVAVEAVAMVGMND